MKKRILVAGIGNIFLGDDAFGVEVVRELLRRPIPGAVRVEDFGIRSYDLAFAIMDGYEAAILVDAVPRAQAPGTLYLIEPEIDARGGPVSVDAHSMNPVAVLQLAEALGGRPSNLYLVGCEPDVLETDEIGLSPSVRAAVPKAVEMIESLLCRLLNESSGGDRVENRLEPVKKSEHAAREQERPSGQAPARAAHPRSGLPPSGQCRQTAFLALAQRVACLFGFACVARGGTRPLRVWPPPSRLGQAKNRSAMRRFLIFSQVLS